MEVIPPNCVIGKAESQTSLDVILLSLITQVTEEMK